MSLSSRIKETLPAIWMRVGFCCALAVIAILAAPAGSALAANWTLRQLPRCNFSKVNRYEAGLSGVSCPSESLCVAVGGQDSLAFSQAPTGTAAAWHVVNPSSGKSCPEGEPLCGTPGSDLRAVSCASQNLCVVVSYEGFVYVSTEPTRRRRRLVADRHQRKRGTRRHASDRGVLPLTFPLRRGVQWAQLWATRPARSSPPPNRPRATGKRPSSPARPISAASPAPAPRSASPSPREGRIFVSTDPTGGASAWVEVGHSGGSR